MGEVYLAEDTSLHRKVALKFLPAYLQQDATAPKRFQREARSAAALDHPYICKIYEVAKTEDDLDFIVMEYVEGQTLQAKLAEGPLPLKEALKIGTEVAEALEKAHSLGIVHRDLKPANIMLTPEDHTKVMDFGLAKKVVQEPGAEEDITSALTRERSTLGTLAYMSPEQIRAKPVDQRSDVFSLGIVLFEMVTGVHPFRETTQNENIGAILHEDPPPLGAYREAVPELIQHTLNRMLAKDPGQHYQSVHEVRTNLEQIRETSGSQVARLQPSEVSRRAVWWGLGLAVVLIGIFGGIVIFLGWTGSLRTDQSFSTGLYPCSLHDRPWL